MGRSNSESPSSSSSSSSSIESSNYTSSRTDLSTDLRLGLSISSSTSSHHHNSRDADWPPIKQSLRNTLGKKGNSTNRHNHQPTLFVKVYMEGIPIGRKLDLFTIHGYDGLIRTLSHMFTTTLLHPSGVGRVNSNQEHHLLTYEDKEGDWMMVGDVPWDLFLATVKRLKITSSDQC